MGGGLTILPALALLVGAGLLGACSAPGPGETPPEPGDGATTSSSDPSGPGRYAEYVTFAREDVHERFGHPLETITVLGVEPVVWTDSSLGCPRTGRTYEPGEVDGYRIVLGWEDLRFEYHGADGSIPFHCMFLDG
jgi:hypothetical protein